MRGLRAVALSAVLLAAGATGARAQGDGVTVDPRSPSGKEYAIPLESARRQADPAQGQDTQSTPGQAALFGAGVTTSGRGGTGSAEGQDSATRQTTAGGQTRKERRADRKQRRADRKNVPAVVEAAALRPGAPDAGIGTSALFVALGLLVVLVGVGAGVMVRRRTRA